MTQLEDTSRIIYLVVGIILLLVSLFLAVRTYVPTTSVVRAIS